MGVWNKMKSYRTALHDSKLFMDLANNSHLCRWCCGPYIPSAAASILQPGRVLRQRYTHRTPFWHPTVVIVDRYNLEVRFFVKPARRHCYGISLVIRCGELPREKKPAVRGRNWQNAAYNYNRSGAARSLRCSAETATWCENSRFLLCHVMLCIPCVNYRIMLATAPHRTWLPMTGRIIVSIQKLFTGSWLADINTIWSDSL